MKVLHALVGYLAVTALPLYPFAIAYPLATIDYDSYVNTTQNQKHVIGNIVDTCQTVSTQNPNDSACIKRVSGDIIEARQYAVPIALLVIALIGAVAITLVIIGNDDPKRIAFTKGSISKTFAKYPKFNWVICHSPYSIGFDGVEGTDWGYTHHELGVAYGRTIGYDLYWARSGKFYRHGDGGFINWAYNGNIIGTLDDGATVHFGTIT